ncbi:extracellular solute-binding protein [Paenibacillus sp. NRS-1760]|uniref:extracellular solute-binding protein n=1 Tax=Paenibacillus sp. NRS-1760 TaxID=3233902 RepID=UPI003D264F55
MANANKYGIVKVVLLVTLSAVCILPQSFQSKGMSTVKAASNAADTSEAISEQMLGSKSENRYDQYLVKHQNAPRPGQEIIIPGDTFSKVVDMKANVVNDMAGLAGNAVESDETGSISWEFDVTNEGLYNIAILFYPMEGKGADIDRELLLDGEAPFAESRNLVFGRVWTSKAEIARDMRGNDTHVQQVELPMWQETYARSADGRHNEPYLYYFTQGKHSITLVSAKEKMLIRSIKLNQVEQAKDYEAVAAEYESNGYKDASDVMIKVQAELADLKSSQVLYPMMDRSSPSTEPYHMSQIRLNTIGGFNWAESGQWMTWDIEVPEDGLYHIGIKYKQSFQRGMISYRKMYIDGKLPFQEADGIAFGFSTNWEMNELGDGKSPYQFYLTKGKHEIKLEVTLGEMALLLRTVESSVLDLNYIFRRIIMVTGTVPDEYRDYQLDKKIPEMIEVFTKQIEVLKSIVERVEKISGGSSDRTATLNRLIFQLQDMVDAPETIARRLETFKSNTSSLGDWIYSINYMPLSIDYLVIASPDKKMPAVKAKFFKRMKHQVGTFMLSFFTDYNVLGSTEKGSKKITVWMTQGIDQAKIAKRLIDESFTPETGVAVDIKVVSEGVLMQAMLAGRGPDVSFALPEDKPVNYALRNAVEDLSKYPGFDKVKQRFHESALVPYEFNKGTFALPIEQQFPVLFYRKDILEEMNLEIPQTWEDVFEIIPELQKQNLLFGFPIQVLVKTGANVQDNATLPVNFTFGTMLFQNGGEIYRNGDKASALDTEVSVKSFIDWTELYTTYKLPLTTDFVNRFRSGEMPIAIADYTRFNLINVVAPELKGLWNFTLVPGLEQADGTIRREVPATGTAAIMLKDSKHKEEAWSFLDWWTSTDVQAKYSLEIEAIFGPAGRTSTANLEAVARIPWQVKDYNVLMEQWKWAKGLPEVAGGYFTGRHLDNAFRSVVISNEDPREAIDHYTKFINEEIVKKRKEFGLPN